MFWELCRVWNLSLKSVQLRSEPISIWRSCARFQPQPKAVLKFLRMKKNLNPHLKQGSNLKRLEPGLTFRQLKCHFSQIVGMRDGVVRIPTVEKTTCMLQHWFLPLIVLLHSVPVPICLFTNYFLQSPRMYVAWILLIHSHLWLTLSMTRFVGPMLNGTDDLLFQPIL